MPLIHLPSSYHCSPLQRSSTQPLSLLAITNSFPPIVLSNPFEEDITQTLPVKVTHNFHVIVRMGCLNLCLHLT